jgi:hypothetical protein
MDTSAGSQNNGHGPAEPQASLPSTVVAPLGAPVSASPAAAAGEKPAGSPDEVRDEKGRIKKGKTLNPKGRPPGIPNLNSELCRAVRAWKLGDRTFLNLLLAKCLNDVEYAKLVLPTLLANATEGKPLIDASDHSQEHNHHSETHVSIGERLGHEGTRRAVAALTEQLALGGAFSGEPRHVRQ